MFDFTDVFKFIDIIRENRLLPGFELMGNPAGHFTNFTDQIDDWKNLMDNLVDSSFCEYIIKHQSTIHLGPLAQINNTVRATFTV